MTAERTTTDKPRLIFLGTPVFAVPSLQRLAETGAYDIVQVITQPDRPAGRGRKLRPSPVKEAAQALGLPVWTPETLKTPDAVAYLRDLAPDVAVVVAYGEILRPNVLAIPPKGFLNVHASLLPKYRGAAPIQAAILNGDRETGVSIMLLDEGMDTGPVLAQRVVPIAPDETAGTLSEKLAQVGAELLVETLPRWLAGEIEPRPQDHSQATVTRLIKKAHGRIDWTAPAVQIERQVRAFTPWPSAFTTWDGRLLKVLRARVVNAPAHDAEPGTVVALDEGPAVVTGEGLLLLEEVQLEGKRPTTGKAFLQGYSQIVGARLGADANE
ncbi:MAG: methionyl-tRNA formyltransferase [Ardenticatenia bacterium]|nr:MAG: methionyl-tRNA formyltransferase [Ardenticatenia bacterium]